MGFVVGFVAGAVAQKFFGAKLASLVSAGVGALRKLFSGA